jgi:hypothetical protein
MIWEVELILYLFVIVTALVALEVKDLFTAVVSLPSSVSLWHYCLLRWVELMLALPKLLLGLVLQEYYLSLHSIKQPYGQTIEILKNIHISCFCRVIDLWITGSAIPG